MSRALEFTIPADVHPAVEQMLLHTAFSTSELCGRFAEINEERIALRGASEHVQGLEMSPDTIIGADMIAELPLAHPEKPISSLFEKNEEKLDKSERELKNSHEATMRTLAAELWQMQPALAGRTPDIIGMAAVLETVTPYEGDRQQVLTRTAEVFDWMRWRVAYLQMGMPVLGFEPTGADQRTTFGGVVQEVMMREGQHHSVVLDLALHNGKQLSRPLPPLITPSDPNFLFYAGKEQGEFAQNARSYGLPQEDIDRAMREARPQRF